MLKAAGLCITIMTVMQPDMAAAENTFSRLIGTAERISENIPHGPKRDAAFSKVALAYARHGYYERVGFIIDIISDPAARISAILDAINYARIREQDQDAARRLLLVANISVKQIENTGTRDNRLWQIAYHQALNGQSTEAHDTAKRIEAAILQDQAHYQIASAQSQIGDIEGAIASAEAMRPGKWRDDAFAVIAGAVAKSGDTNKAREMAERSRSQKQTALYFMAQSRSETEDFETGLALSRDIPSPRQRALSLQLMAEKAMKFGKPDIARKFLQEARASARETQYPSGPLTWIGSAQAKAGFISDALETAADIELRPLRERWGMGGDGVLWVLRETAQAQHSQGRIEEARLTVDLANRARTNSGNKNQLAAIEIIRMAMIVGNTDMARKVAG